MTIRCHSRDLALFKLKPDADQKHIRKWQSLAQGMVGQVPG